MRSLGALVEVRASHTRAIQVESFPKMLRIIIKYKCWGVSQSL